MIVQNAAVHTVLGKKFAESNCSVNLDHLLDEPVWCCCADLEDGEDKSIMVLKKVDRKGSTCIWEQTTMDELSMLVAADGDQGLYYFSYGMLESGSTRDFLKVTTEQRKVSLVCVNSVRLQECLDQCYKENQGEAQKIASFSMQSHLVGVDGGGRLVRTKNFRLVTARKLEGVQSSYDLRGMNNAKSVTLSRKDSPAADLKYDSRIIVTQRGGMLICCGETGKWLRCGGGSGGCDPDANSIVIREFVDAGFFTHSEDDKAGCTYTEKPGLLVTESGTHCVNADDKKLDANMLAAYEEHKSTAQAYHIRPMLESTGTVFKHAKCIKMVYLGDNGDPRLLDFQLPMSNKQMSPAELASWCMDSDPQ